MSKGFVNKNSLINDLSSKFIPEMSKDILRNPYYLFNDKTLTISTYYNLNTTMTTLDESTRENYAELTPNSPLRFNKILGFYIYGISKIEPNLDINEYGLEGDNITGEAVILPNTVIPYPGDRFIIDYLGDNYIFLVDTVNPNTLETGSTMYKINYTLCASDGIQTIEDKVVKIYKFIASNIGTNFSTFLEEEEFLKLSELENISKCLKDYYLSLFYDVKIQSLAYYKENSGFKVYDPYLLEFIIRNDILENSSEDIYLSHQMFLPNTFNIDYDRTIFSSIENNDITHHIGVYIGNLLLCQQELSLLYAYPQDYYYMKYGNFNNKFYVIDIFNDPEFGKKLRENIKTGNVFKDILIGYINNENITQDQITNLKHIDFENNMEFYYYIPITIFILDKYIQSQLTNK